MWEEALIRRALEEDAAWQDRTSEYTVSGKGGRLLLRAQSEGVLSGVRVAGRVFQIRDPSVRVVLHAKDGERVEPGAEILTAEGPLVSLFSAVRTALNFLMHLSGVASLTAQFVARARPYGVRVRDTRKTLPGLRALQKEAVRHGGGENHRMDLRSLFLKAEHAEACGGLERALEKVFARNPETVVVEVRNPEEYAIARNFPVHCILLDNWPPEAIRRLKIPPPEEVCVEASGNLDLNNLEDYLRTGIHAVSVGRLTHSAPALPCHAELRSPVTV